MSRPVASIIADAYAHDADALLRYILQRVEHPQDAEDLLQDVFVRVLELQADYEERGFPLSTLLYRIAHGRTIDWQRRQTHRRTVRIPDVADGQPPVGERMLTEPDLADALARLSPRQRAVLAWRFTEGATITETAARLGLTPPVVKALQHRALVRLRVVLQREAGEAD